MTVTPFEVKILPLSKSWFLLFASFNLLAFFIPIIEVTLFTFKERTLTVTFSHNKNQAAFSTSHLIIIQNFITKEGKSMSDVFLENWRNA